MVQVLGEAVYELDLLITQGATNDRKLRWSAGSPRVPVDMTGWEARAQVRRSHSSDVAWLTLSSGSGITLGSDGIVEISIPYEATEGPEWDDRDAGVWDLELTSPSGTRRRLVEGLVVVSHEVTRG